MTETIILLLIIYLMGICIIGTMHYIFSGMYGRKNSVIGSIFAGLIWPYVLWTDLRYM